MDPKKFEKDLPQKQGVNPNVYFLKRDKNFEINQKMQFKKQHYSTSGSVRNNRFTDNSKGKRPLSLLESKLIDIPDNQKIDES